MATDRSTSSEHPGTSEVPEPPQRLESGRDDRGRALVIHPWLRPRPARDIPPSEAQVSRGVARSPEARLEEAVGLARAIDLAVVRTEMPRLNAYRPATLIGSGVVDALKPVIANEAISVAIVDAALTPIQQRNLERAWSCKVIDRTGLILEIFGARARTKEGQMQVELAALTYQRSRLVRSWTHLERQRGGFGFLGGPGESQLEIDRRLIGERIAQLRRDLDEVKRTRELHRAARRRVPYAIVALVGYTNAGKSTLFNRLTQASVQAEDLLFATLDPTMRRIALPSGRQAILSDTVGFISDLPTELVAAFRATLEEVREADLILHVRDVSHPDSEAQRADVEGVLQALELAPEIEAGLLEVLNKADRLDPEERARLAATPDGDRLSVVISALTGEGCRQLLEGVDRRLGEGRPSVYLSLPLSDGSGIAWLYAHGEVLERRDDDSLAHIVVRLAPADLARLEARQGAERKSHQSRPRSRPG